MTPLSQLLKKASGRSSSDCSTTVEPPADSLSDLMQPDSGVRNQLRESAGSETCALRISNPDDSIAWAQLKRNTLYAHIGRRVCDLTLLLVCSGPALVIGLTIAAINLIQFRSFSKIFFLQERVGYRGEIFTIFKFRTMGEARAGNFEAWSNGGDQVRVTRIGRLLRNTHLDELPQLINVALGQMAFVGPRPEMVEIEEWAAGEVEGFSSRLATHPGVSGYAQITQGYTGNDVEAYEEKFRVADWYRRHQSFALDLKILAMTLVWMVRGRGWSWNAEGEKPKIELPE